MVVSSCRAAPRRVGGLQRAQSDPAKSWDCARLLLFSLPKMPVATTIPNPPDIRLRGAVVATVFFRKRCLRAAQESARRG